MSVFLVTVIVCSMYLGLALAWPHAGRVIFGISYLVTALFNFAVTSRDPVPLIDYGIANTFIPSYAALLNVLVIPHAMFFIVALGVAWEALIGVFILAGGNAARFGFLAAIFFNFVIAPMSPAIAVGNVLLALGEASLLRFRFDEGAFAQFREPPRRQMV